MGLNLDDERFGLIPFDDKGIVELREPDPFESKIDHPSSHREDLSCRLRGLRHHNAAHFVIQLGLSDRLVADARPSPSATGQADRATSSRELHGPAGTFPADGRPHGDLIALSELKTSSSMTSQASLPGFPKSYSDGTETGASSRM